jgi:hypothetical protein
VAELAEQSLGQFDVPVALGTQARSLSRDGDELVLHTDAGDLRSRALIVAGGHGAVEPRRLPELDLSAWEGRGVQHVVGAKGELATGFAEAATAVSQAVLALRPGAPLQPGYSTNTRVPGVVAGQA